MKKLITTAFLVLLCLCEQTLGSADCEKTFVALESGAHAHDVEAIKETALSVVPKYQGYFDSIRGDLKERDYLVELAELALLSKEHLLLMGPPGNAKSMLSDRILGNMKGVDGKSSYYRIQMTPETTISETHGPLDYKTLTESNRYERLYDEGMLNSRNVFIDEIFDARSNAMRNILGLLAERAHAQGPRVIPGKIETAIAATNKYIGEVYERSGNDDPKALLDRFAFSAFVPGEFENTKSAVELITGAKREKKLTPQLSFEDLDKARALVAEVEIPENVAEFLVLLSNKVKADTESLEASEGKKHKEKLRNNEEAEQPYRATKFHSPRTLGKAGGILKAIVARDWLLKDGKRELKANIGDIKQLEKFFTLNGPNTQFIEHLLGKAPPKERAQLEAILQERQLFKRHFDESLHDMNSVIYHYALSDIQNELEGHPTAREKETIAKKVAAKLIEVENRLDRTGNLSHLTGEQLGLKYVHSYLKETLEHLTEQDGKGGVEKWLSTHRTQLTKEHERQLAEARAKEKADKKAEAEAAAQRGSRSNEDVFEKAALDAQSKAAVKAAEKKSFDYTPIVKKGEKKTVTMGTPGSTRDEKPWNATLTRPFEMASTPVTQLQWALVMGNNPSSFKDANRLVTVNGVQVDPNRPVETVSWNTIQTYIQKLNELDPKYHYRLPTEAEWEYSARAGTSTTYHFGDDKSQLNDHAWNSANAGNETHPVSEKKPNQLGLYDMLGNVWEWVEDIYVENPPGGTDPVVTSGGSDCVIRGGCWLTDAVVSRSAYRNRYSPTDVSTGIGFRLVRTPK